MFQQPTERGRLFIRKIGNITIDDCDLLITSMDGVSYVFPSFVFKTFLCSTDTFERTKEDEKYPYKLTLRKTLASDTLSFLHAYVMGYFVCLPLSTLMQYFRELWNSNNFNFTSLTAIWKDNFQVVFSYIRVWNEEHVPHYEDYIELLKLARAFSLPIVFNVVPRNDFLLLLNKEYHLIVYLVASEQSISREIRLQLYNQYILVADKNMKKELETSYDRFFS